MLTLHFFSVNWWRRHDFPTPISPMMIYLKMYSYGNEAILSRGAQRRVTGLKKKTSARRREEEGFLSDTQEKKLLFS